MKEIIPARKKRYDALKKTALECSKSFWLYCEVVCDIRDEELWDQEFDSFREFCEQSLGISKQRAYQMIQAWDVRKSISESTTVDSITNEGQARALGSVPEGQRVKVLKSIAKSGDPITADSIKVAAAAVVVDKQPEDPPRITQPSLSNVPRVPMADKPVLKPKSESGKPLHSLIIWTEIEGLYGKALNRLDELNRVCREPACHGSLIAATKACMKALEEWRESVRKA